MLFHAATSGPVPPVFVVSHGEGHNNDVCLILCITHAGTCVAAGYTGGCCTNGACKGLPPTCSCDSTCAVFQDCCIDVPPSCQPGIKLLPHMCVSEN